MKKYYSTLLMIIIAFSLTGSAVFAAHIPPLWIYFALSSLAMLAAIVLLRLNSKKELLAIRSEKNPLNGLRMLVQNQVAEVDTFLDMKEKDGAWTDKLEDSLERFYLRLEDLRPALLETVGMKKYVTLIAPFARAERLLNRALSAGIDKYFQESHKSLAEGKELLQFTLHALQEME